MAIEDATDEISNFWLRIWILLEKQILIPLQIMQFGEVTFVAIFSIEATLAISHDPDWIWTNGLRIQILLEK